MKAKASYTVIYERDESGAWNAQVSEIPGCLTHGRTIEQARERIREALQAWFDLPAPFAGTIKDEVRLPNTAQRTLRAAVKARLTAERAQELAAAVNLKAIGALREVGLSLSDAGELLGFSRQRIHQLLEKPAAPAKRKTSAGKASRA